MAHMLILLLVVASTTALAQGITFASKTGTCRGQVFVSRAVWGAKPPRRELPIPLPVRKLIIHHSASPQCKTIKSCSRRLRGMQRRHMRKKAKKGLDIDDIGYNYLVDRNGRVYEGRGWGFEGGHTKHHDRDAVAICAIGNFEIKKPSDKMLQAIANLIDCALEDGALTHNFKIYGHKNFANKACPGKHLQKYIIASSHYGG